MKAPIHLIAAAVLSVASFTACSEEDDSSSDQRVEVSFSAVVGDSALTCGELGTLGVNSASASLRDFRMYVHDVSLLGVDGEKYPLTFEDTGVWQSAEVALLDFEDATGTCDNGNGLTNTVIVGAVAGGVQFDGIQFTVGVPEELNHTNSATAEAPLNVTGMDWNWTAGRKFLRLDLIVDGSEVDYRIHLGSTMCDGDPGATVTCARANRATVELTGFDPTSTPVVVDIESLVSGIAIEANTTDTPPGCMSGPTDPDCPAAFDALGIDFTTGASVGTQSLFFTE